MTWWWNPREEGEPTNKYLERVLRAVRLGGLADQAAAYYFDDYLCPDDAPWAGLEHLHLAHELFRYAEVTKPPIRQKIEAVREAVVAGEFDATREESDEWAASPKGKATLALLMSRHNG